MSTDEKVKKYYAEWQELLAQLPTHDGVYKGQTYVWERDCNEWYARHAPSGMSGPEYDLPLVPYVEGTADKVARDVLGWAVTALGIDVDVEAAATRYAEDQAIARYWWGQ
jgi:hypothetical protein